MAFCKPSGLTLLLADRLAGGMRRVLVQLDFPSTVPGQILIVPRPLPSFFPCIHLFLLIYYIYVLYLFNIGAY